MAWQEQRAPGRKKYFLCDIVGPWTYVGRRRWEEARQREVHHLAAKRRLLVAADEMHLAESLVARAAASNNMP
jgi:hypothetical protein